MPEFEKIDRDHVLRAMSEYDRRGADGFLAHHGLSPAREYLLTHEKKEYDSMAILGVAHQYAVGRGAGADEFSGGREGAAKVLQDLGFDVKLRTDDPDDSIDASEVGSDEARSAWATAGRQALVETAGVYHSVVTYKEFSSAVMRMTGIRTKQLTHYWIGDVLGRISEECARLQEPLLSSLCVNAEGSVGEGYAAAVLRARGTRPGDPDEHAATERLECYRHFGADLPPGGGVAALTPKVKAGRDRARRARQAEKVSAMCPKCHIAVPASGVCDNCD